MLILVVSTSIVKRNEKNSDILTGRVLNNSIAKGIIKITLDPKTSGDDTDMLW